MRDANCGPRLRAALPLRSARTSGAVARPCPCSRALRRVTSAPRRQTGVTLVELVVALSLATIVAAFVALFIKTPVDAYFGQTRRAELVDAADNVLRDVAREVRAALPNSVRASGSGASAALELLATVDAVRYRDSTATTMPADELDFSAPDSQFSTIGKFDVPRPFTSSTHYLAIYNVGVSGADAYEAVNVITPAASTITIADAPDPSRAAIEDQVTLAPAFRFAYGSPARRVFLVSGPVSFLCDAAARTLTRYSGYTLDPDHGDRDSHAELAAAGAASELIARNVSACRFTYSAGIAERAALLTMEITVARDGESVRLLHQVHVENAP
jgi:MSHA biogenesis protein MshO